jgi:hypothetical protein
MPELEKRTHVHIQRPKDYEISGCPCGNTDPDWSEYKGHLWCPICKIDFIPKSGGIFDGPIPVEACRLIGIDLREINILTREVEDRVGQWPASPATGGKIKA